jgi:hypothetical protein
LFDSNQNDRITGVPILPTNAHLIYSQFAPFAATIYAIMAAAMAATPAYPKALMLSAALEEVAVAAPVDVPVEPVADVLVEEPAEVAAADPEEAGADEAEPEPELAAEEEAAADEEEDEPDSPKRLAPLEPTIPPETPEPAALLLVLEAADL